MILPQIEPLLTLQHGVVACLVHPRQLAERAVQEQVLLQGVECAPVGGVRGPVGGSGLLDILLTVIIVGEVIEAELMVFLHACRLKVQKGNVAGYNSAGGFGDIVMFDNSPYVKSAVLPVFSECKEDSLSP